MASYLEIKRKLAEILYLESEMNEECDIVLKLDSNLEEDSVTFHNEMLKAAFDRVQNYETDGLDMRSATFREVALQISGLRPTLDVALIDDPVNHVTYSCGPASLDYCIFLLDKICESEKSLDSVPYFSTRLRAHRNTSMRRKYREFYIENENELLSYILQTSTIRVASDGPINSNRLKDYAASFEFVLMYKRDISISEYTDIHDMYSINRVRPSRRRGEIDSPPRRIFNPAVLDYYAMAMASRDPFTAYISFYHIVEHYFDAVFRKNLTEAIKGKITQPDFSYKSEAKLYDLAKFIKNHMSSDDESGKGDELQSLKYVLMEYAPIEDLKNQINSLNPDAVAYYQDHYIPFTSSRKTKIAWGDSEGVYTTLANRIYSTRNALIHSKSEQAENQYKPYQHRNALNAEIPLMRAAAEIVLINSSKII